MKELWSVGYIPKGPQKSLAPVWTPEKFGFSGAFYAALPEKKAVNGPQRLTWSEAWI